MYNIEFEYCDRYTNGEWRRQRCTVSSIAECIEIYGLGIDCDYRIISVEGVGKDGQNASLLADSAAK